MPRNLLLYGAAILVGMLVYFVLRALLGGEIMFIVALIGLVVGGVIVFRNLKTNRQVTEASPEQRAEALAFTPVTDKAALYIYRNQFVGKAVGLNVLIDGRAVAQLKSPRFTRIVLTPGAHRIAGYTGTNKPPSEADGAAFNATAGEVIVMKAEVEPQLVGVTVKFTPALDTGRGDMQKITKMVVADVAEI